MTGIHHNVGNRYLVKPYDVWKDVMKQNVVNETQNVDCIFLISNDSWSKEQKWRSVARKDVAAT